MEIEVATEQCNQNDNIAKQEVKREKTTNIKLLKVPVEMKVIKKSRVIKMSTLQNARSILVVQICQTCV